MFGIDAAGLLASFPYCRHNFRTSLRGLENRESFIYEKHLEKMSKHLKRTLKIGRQDSRPGLQFRRHASPRTHQSLVPTCRKAMAITEQMAFVDIDSLRVMSGMTVGASENITLTKAQTSMLATDDTDALFGDDIIASSAAPVKLRRKKSFSHSRRQDCA